MKVKFTYTQIIPTIHPNFSVTVHFKITAVVNDDEVVVYKILACPLFDGDFTQESIVVPDESTTEGAIFVGIIREAARNEAHRISKQAVREAAQNKTV